MFDFDTKNASNSSAATPLTMPDQAIAATLAATQTVIMSATPASSSTLAPLQECKYLAQSSPAASSSSPGPSATQKALEFQLPWLEFVDGLHNSVHARQRGRRIDEKVSVEAVTELLLPCHAECSIYDIQKDGSLLVKETLAFLKMRSAMFSCSAGQYADIYLAFNEKEMRDVSAEVNMGTYQLAELCEKHFGGDYSRMRAHFKVEGGKMNVCLEGKSWDLSRHIEDNLEFSAAEKASYVQVLPATPCADGIDVSAMVRFVSNYLKTQTINTIEDAARIHYELECLHPFKDWNTRANRLLLEKILQDKGWGSGVILDDPNTVYFHTQREWAIIIQQGIAKWNAADARIRAISAKEFMRRLLAGTETV